jgi:hypothetical protein
MADRNYQDIVTGAVLSSLGLCFALYSTSHYGVGTLEHVGNGLFPAASGCALAFFGIVILWGGFVKPGSGSMPRMQVPFLIILSVAAFALLITPFGMIPSIVVSIVIASFADLKTGIRGLALLSGVMCAMTYLIFRLGLGLLIPMINWPF